MAQTDDELLAEIRDEAPDLELPRLDHATARAIGLAAMAEIEAGALAATVRVVRAGQIAFQASFAGTTPEHDDWLRRKTNSVLRHDIASLELALRHRVSGRTPDWLDAREYALAGGAVPLRVAGSMAGVVAVSGLVDSIRADHDVAMRAILAVRDTEAAR